MIRPFDVRDLLLVGKLHNQGMLLNLEEALTQTYRPLWEALVGWLPLQGMGVCTYVCDEAEKREGMAGFAQVRIRKESSEADVVYLTPSLSASKEAVTIWCHLLEHLCLEVGKQGIERIFAHLPEDRPEIEAFQQVGFSIYAREDIFRLVQIPSYPSQLEKRTMRPQQATDSWGLRGLYAAVAPRLVQQTENLTAIEWDVKSTPWLGQVKREGYVLEDEGDVMGYLRICKGRTGHWLKMLLHPQAYDQADDLIEQALSLLAQHPSLPIYCCLRRYQGGLRVPLQTKGFQLFAGQCVMVKHTTARVKEPALKLVPALEKRVEPAAPMMKTPCTVHE